MIFWAPIVSPDSTMAAICFFCASVNWTPTRDREPTPLMGSFSALPSCIAADEASVPIFAAMSAAAFVAWSKILSAPTFLIFLKVRSSASVCMIESSV